MSDPVLIVCGSRKWTDIGLLRRTLAEMLITGNWAGLWHGAAIGADQLANEWARDSRVPVRSWPANWARHGRMAGVMRSAQMIQEAPRGSVVIAFVSGMLSDSAGTAATVKLAQRRGLRVYLSDWLGSRWTVPGPVANSLF